ncbi:MAG TPA: LysR family transcriptional regulator [Povalibacter sp.]|jgi:DNA-binding transcriptional LysR family regulator|nr:LysR family transcriptional regulator [Povalibacter sp.]
MLRQLDLNLLYVLVVLEEKRSVSAAALTLQKSQPAVSGALARLRLFFNDPLFVRSGNSMQPTPRASALIEAARQVLERVGTDIVSTRAFEPGSNRQTISIALSDVGEVVFLPALLRDLRRLAPNALVRSVSLPAADVAAGLESGSIDLAIGYFPDLKKSNFFQQALFTDTFASLLRLDHPVSARKLTLKQYLQLEHAVVHAESRTEEVMERYLARRKIRRKVVLSTPHFASAPIIVAQSDLIVTIPEPLARYFAQVSANVRTVGLPFDAPRIQLKQFWHRKFHHDERNAWLRSRVCELFQRRE